jgi:hypothetical protein
MTMHPESPPVRHRRSLLRAGALGLALAVVCSACGGPAELDIPAAPKGPVYPVTGKVLLPDGKPLTQGTVSFMPLAQPGRVATGDVKSDGTFTLATKDLGEGAPEGKYKVKIDSTLTVPGPKGKPMNAVPPHYQDEDGSGLEVVVKSGPNAVPPFQLSLNRSAGGPMGKGRGRDRNDD